MSLLLKWELVDLGRVLPRVHGEVDCLGRVLVILERVPQESGSSAARGAKRSRPHRAVAEFHGTFLAGTTHGWWLLERREVRALGKRPKQHPLH